MQRQIIDMLAGLNIPGAQCPECNVYMLTSGIASTRGTRANGPRLPMSARGWNERFRLSD